jgi:hypothetical protein
MIKRTHWLILTRSFIIEARVDGHAVRDQSRQASLIVRRKMEMKKRKRRRRRKKKKMMMMKKMKKKTERRRNRKKMKGRRSSSTPPSLWPIPNRLFTIAAKESGHGACHHLEVPTKLPFAVPVHETVAMIRAPLVRK